MSSTIVQELHLVVPLQSRKRTASDAELDIDAASARLNLTTCASCEDAEQETAQFSLMRMRSIHTNAVNSIRNNHHTAWVPFSSESSDIRALYQTLASVEAAEHALGVHTCRCQEGAPACYELEAAIHVTGPDEDGLHRSTHKAEVDTSGIRLDQRWPRVGEWHALASPRAFALAC